MTAAGRLEVQQFAALQVLLPAQEPKPAHLPQGDPSTRQRRARSHNCGCAPVRGSQDAREIPAGSTCNVINRSVELTTTRQCSAAHYARAVRAAISPSPPGLAGPLVQVLSSSSASKQVRLGSLKASANTSKRLIDQTSMLSQINRKDKFAHVQGCHNREHAESFSRDTKKSTTATRS